MRSRKDENMETVNNIINQLSVNNEIVAAVPDIWFNDFVPAINHFAEKYNNPLEADEIYTKTQYFDSINKSAEMNYTSGWLLNTGGWICDHSSLNKASLCHISMKVSGSVWIMSVNVTCWRSFCRQAKPHGRNGSVLYLI